MRWCALAVGMLWVAGSAMAGVEVKKQDGKDVIDVTIDGKPFTAYHYSKEWKKPFLWPVLSEGGVGVTRDFPMDMEDTPKDHPHHKSMWSAYGEVNGVDCWAEGGNSGFQESGEVTSGTTPEFGWIRAKNTWTDKEHKPVMDEEREYRFYPSPENGRLIDVLITFTASHGDVLWSDTKEGGIVSVRMREEISGEGKAIITNALGDVGEANLWGKPAAWCDFSGDIPGAGVRGLTIFDHPTNLRYPTSWHVRNYGLMGANMFGYEDFGGKDYNKGLLPMEKGDLTLKNGEQLSFTFRVYVHSGDVAQAKVAEKYEEFAALPAPKPAQ